MNRKHMETATFNTADFRLDWRFKNAYLEYDDFFLRLGIFIFSLKKKKKEKDKTNHSNL